MPTWIKSLVVWLIVAALPLHGIASASRVVCGTMLPSHATAGQFAEDADVGMHHAVSGHTAAFVMKHDKAACSTCGLCCAGAVSLLSRPVPASSGTASEPVLVPPAEMSPGYVPSRLDKPPKTSLPA